MLEESKSPSILGVAWSPTTPVNINVTIPGHLFSQLTTMLQPFNILNEIVKKVTEDNVNSGNFKPYTIDDLDENGKFKPEFMQEPNVEHSEN